jgi:hypothetical protein
MFSDDQLKKISYFASITKITNGCFKKCVEIDINKKDNQSIKLGLTTNEVNCIKSCSINYVKLRQFVEVQLLEDYESIKNKNRQILQDET